MKIPALFLILLITFAARADDEWQTYTNARFGFRLSYPPGLVASRNPENGGGREFHGKDGEFSVAAFGNFLMEQNSFEESWKDECKELGGTVTYKKKTASWFVISGVKDGTEYYHKTIVQGQNAAHLHITYPHAKAKKYDPWVERIARDFVPFLKGDYDRITK